MRYSSSLRSEQECFKVGSDSADAVNTERREHTNVSIRPDNRDCARMGIDAVLGVPFPTYATCDINIIKEDPVMERYRFRTPFYARSNEWTCDTHLDQWGRKNVGKSVMTCDSTK